MSWEPTEQEVEEKLIELAYTWGDIEEELDRMASRTDVEADDALRNEAGFNAGCLERAYRVEAVFDRNEWDDPCSLYDVLFDVADKNARVAARELDESGYMLRKLILENASPWHTRYYLRIRAVPRGTPVSGEICRRLGQQHPAEQTPDLSDVPTLKPTGSDVELVERDGHWLTPIEVPFYDALRETGLFFAVQPWIQATDRKYRLDFLVFYDGGAVAVELDGHEYHKTREQRGRDASRDRWFAARKVQTLRWTGSQVFADPEGCVKELLDVVRGSQARP